MYIGILVTLWFHHISNAIGIKLKNYYLVTILWDSKSSSPHLQHKLLHKEAVVDSFDVFINITRFIRHCA